MINKSIELFTDGSSLRNPGASGLGYIIKYTELSDDDFEGMPETKTIEGNQGFRLSTNNRMEIMAGIYGLNRIIHEIKNGIFINDIPTQITLSSDSDYFVKAIKQNWITRWQSNNWLTSNYNGQKPKDVKNKDLWEQIINIQNQLRSMNINLIMNHVEGHAGHEFNERADQLAVAASNDGQHHLIDEMYEKIAPVLNK